MIVKLRFEISDDDRRALRRSQDGRGKASRQEITDMLMRDLRRHLESSNGAVSTAVTPPAKIVTIQNAVCPRCDRVIGVRILKQSFREFFIGLYAARIRAGTADPKLKEIVDA